MKKRGSCLFLVSYLIIFLHFLIQPLSYFYINMFFPCYYFSCTVFRFCGSWLSQTGLFCPVPQPSGKLTSLPAVKVSIFPQEIWHVCSFYCQLSNTVSLEQQQVCWSVCWRSNICLKPVVSVFFSLRSFSAITAIFYCKFITGVFKPRIKDVLVQ